MVHPDRRPPESRGESNMSKFEFKPEAAQKAIEVLNAEAVLQEDLISKVAKEAPQACSAETAQNDDATNAASSFAAPV